MIAIIDYGMGNLGSIANMLKTVGIPAVISSESSVIASADRLILPGVGAFDAAMQRLQELRLTDLIIDRAVQERVPLLGICLGMQLLSRSSEEGSLSGLGLINADTVRFDAAILKGGKKIPHIGWNSVRVMRENPIIHVGASEQRFYFVHSYYVRCADAADIVGVTDHGVDFTSVLHRDNIVATQFHPEKSHRFGMELLRNFARM